MSSTKADATRTEIKGDTMHKTPESHIRDINNPTDLHGLNACAAGNQIISSIENPKIIIEPYTEDNTNSNLKSACNGHLPAEKLQINH